MAITGFYKIADNSNNVYDGIKRYPIQALIIYDPATQNGLNFFTIESESSYNITPITKTNHFGRIITCAYKVEMTIYVSQNRFKKVSGNDYYLKVLESYINKQVVIQLALGNLEPDPNQVTTFWNYIDTNLTTPIQSQLLTKTMNADEGMLLDFGKNMSLSFEIENVELRPRLKIKGFGILQSPVNIITYDDTGNYTTAQKSLFKS